MMGEYANSYANKDEFPHVVISKWSNLFINRKTGNLLKDSRWINAARHLESIYFPEKIIYV